MKMTIPIACSPKFLTSRHVHRALPSRNFPSDVRQTRSPRFALIKPSLINAPCPPFITNTAYPTPPVVSARWPITPSMRPALARAAWWTAALSEGRGDVPTNEEHRSAAPRGRPSGTATRHTRPASLWPRRPPAALRNHDNWWPCGVPQIPTQTPDT